MGVLDSNTAKWLPVDLGGGRTTINKTNHEIHEGNYFTVCHTKAMDTVTAHTMTITAPASAVGYIHLVVGVDLTAAGNWVFSEAPEASAGSALTIFNNKRNSTTTSGTTIKAGAVVWTSAGTAIETHYIGANNPASRLGGGTDIREEYILSPSTTYGIRVLNNAATCYSVINAHFYLA